MFDKLFLTLIKSKYTWIALAILAVGITMYSLYTQNQNLKAEKMKLNQNITAYADSVNKQRDTIQTIAASVQNLNKEKDTWKDKYVAVQNKYDISIGTINVLNDKLQHVNVIGDSIVQVPFSGKEGIASYSGQTSGNVKSQMGKLDSIRIAFDPIDIRSMLFFNDVTKLWEIRTISMTPGVTLRGYSAIDEETFRKLQGVPQLQTVTPHTFAVGGLAAYDRLYGGIILNPSQWAFSLHYKIFDRNAVANESWSNKIMIGVHYFIW